MRHLFDGEIAKHQTTLAAYEKAKKFAFLEEELSEENGLLTPTQKVRRREVVKRYADAIEAMYAR